MLNTVISHLLGEKLKEGPAQELYKVSAIKFIRTIAKKTSLIQQSTLIKIYLYNLRVSEMQIIIWSIIIEIINEMKNNEISLLLLNYGFNEIHNSIKFLHKYNPELQDAMFDFLYNSLIYFNQIELSDFTKIINICKFVLNEIRPKNNKSNYYERDCYLRLLGKSYVTLVFLNKHEKTIDLDCTNDVYASFCDNLWITSLNEDFRKSVFEIMQSLFLACYERDEYRCEF